MYWVFLCLFCSRLIAFDHFLASFSDRGYYEFENTQLSSTWYDGLYRQFDLLVKEYKENEPFRHMLDNADREFDSRRYGGYYNSMGMSFPARSKQSQLLFFRYCREYRELLETKYRQLLDVAPFFHFLLACDELLETVDKYFFLAIESLKKEGFDTFPLFLRNQKFLSTVLKVVYYQPGSMSGLHLHQDISGLSCLLDHTDEEKEALVLAPYKELLEFSDMKPPKRSFSRRDTTSALFIPGTALKESGIPINATPHAVLPLNSKRYAVIAFAMIPN